jgi:WD40 repeat protein
VQATCLVLLSLLLIGGLAFVSPVAGLISAVVMLGLAGAIAISIRWHEWNAPPLSASFLSDGQIVIVNRRNVVRIIDSENRRLKREFRRQPNWISDVSHSSDGRYTVWAVQHPDGAGTEMHFGESASERPIHSVTTGSGYSSLLISPNGNLFGFLNYGDVCLWSARTGSELRWRGEALDGSLAVAFSGNGKYLVAAQDNFAVVHDLTSTERIHFLSEVDGTVSEVAISGEGRFVAAASDAILQIWDVTAMEPIHTVTATESRRMMFHPTGWHLAFAEDNRTGDAFVTYFDVANGKRVWASPLSEVEDFSSGGFSFSADGRYLIAVSSLGRLHRWILADDGQWSARDVLSRKGWLPF